MSFTTPTHRREARRYNERLIERVRKVGCPRCKAKPGQMCLSPKPNWSNNIQKVNWVHHKRRHQAKLEGFVSGLRKKQGHGCAK